MSGTPNPSTNPLKIITLDSEWTLEIPLSRKDYMYLYHWLNDPYLDDKTLKCAYGGTWVSTWGNVWTDIPICSCKKPIPDKVFKKIIMLETARKQSLSL